MWLVHDGMSLYVDRNGNGDLTEPDERFEADEKTSDPKLEEFYFAVGDIADEPGVHKGLSVTWHKIDHLRDEFPELDQLLDKNPRYRGCNINIDVVMPGQTGSGLGGRVPQSASCWDDRGFLQFAAQPADRRSFISAALGEFRSSARPINYALAARKKLCCRWARRGSRGLDRARGVRQDRPGHDLATGTIHLSGVKER